MQKNVLNIVKSAGTAIMSDTPKWAKVVRLVSLGLSSLGLALANPVAAASVFAILVPYAGSLQVVGTFGAIFVQFFTKKE
jgi:hypothetical protein